jgi:hypothetical protein
VNTPETIETGSEPLGPIALATAVVSALLALLTAFGVHLTTEQVAAILGLVGTGGPLLVWYLGRKKTVPLTNVVALVNKTGETVAADAATQENGTVVAVRQVA